MSDLHQLGPLISIQKGKPPKSFEANTANTQAYLSPEYLRGIAPPTFAERFPNSLMATCGDVVLLWDGSNAGEAFRAKPGIVASTMAVIRPDHSFDLGYFFHALKWVEPHLKSQTNGTGIPHVDRHVLEQVAVYLPAKLDQAKIAEVLDTLDVAIQGTEAVVAKLRAMKQGLLHDLLTRGIDANGDLRPPHPEAPHLYHQTPLGWLPKEWDALPLGDYTQHDITYGIVQAGPHIVGGIPYIRTGDMSGEALVRENMLCTSERIARSYRRSEVRAGELVIAIRATLGKVLPVPDDLDGANLTQGTARISPRANVNPTCLMWAIRHRRGQDAIMKEVKGSTFMEISLGSLRRVPIALPRSRQEQDDIAARLIGHDAAIAKEQALLDKLRLQKSGLMEDLLTGRVSVAPLL
ncbi:restriction endonuclease subunit S [Pseudotabrizicola sp. L79]|uniref:restriction endonuclease subunit S n=1 Tax=Pseudotabrizicola sp. L79 TaxID=3118402 RepID=UPI002F92ACEE